MISSGPSNFDVICYRRNFLGAVIARADFLSPIEALASTLPADLGKAATSRFPIAEPRKASVQEVAVSAEDLSARRTEFTEWIFHGKDREKTLCISQNWLWIEVKRYERYEVLRDDFEAALSAFLRANPQTQINRLGLRYVNRVELQEPNPMDWARYLADYTLAILQQADPKQIARALHVLELNLGDFNLRFQYGMPNPDFPAPIKRKLYVLDLDAYARGPQENNRIGSSLDAFHAAIQERFEATITDALREKMNAERE